MERDFKEMNQKLTNCQKEDVVNFQKYKQSGGIKTFDEWQEIEKQLKVCRVVFDESDHWKGKSFTEFLAHIGMKNPFDDKEKNVAVKKELTKEQLEFEEYTLSGGQGTFSEWLKIMKEK